MDPTPVLTPKIISSSPQQNGGHKIAMILGVATTFVLATGLAIGVFLVQKQQSQSPQSKATASCPPIDGGGDPSQPNPYNEATNVPQNLNLSWQYPTDNYDTHSVAVVKVFSCSDATDSCLVASGVAATNGSIPFSALKKSDGTALDPLACTTQYYWRVDLTAASCPAHVTHSLWTFTTGCGTSAVMPAAVFQPSTNAYCPSNGAGNLVGQTNLKGLAIVHKFSSETECKAFQSNTDPNKWVGIVHYPASVCPKTTQWGTGTQSNETADCQLLNSCRTDQWGSWNTSNPSAKYCELLTATPPCSAIQYDCEDGTSKYNTGTQEVNCNCPAAPTPTPAPGVAACQQVTLSEALSAIKVGDTFYATGSGTTTGDGDKIDKIRFTITKDGTPVVTPPPEINTVADSSSTSTLKVWTATTTYTVPGTGSYSITIQTHWLKADGTDGGWLQ